ncbi:kinase domain-containing protein [Sclerotinia borealis F-4128]|uniref:non-specific serine/threonine protein kinase n=1 Tax=Sclerotinia borealis (strain F-4128) TaxID=1432307 RepID=W9C7V0_SCLBF|nr:kinase domain-containing protein [Sclerotinia borealis F-4128]
MIIEYKAPHKLTLSNLQAGLARATDRGSLDLPKDVLDHPMIPTEPGEKYIYKSEMLTASALTQTFAYMVENGLEYSYLTTGDAFVFLRILEDEPHTLYYHFTQPKVEGGDGIGELLCRTSVSQSVSFSLLALGSTTRSHEWRARTLKTAYKVGTGHEAILLQMLHEEEAVTPPSSAFKARKGDSIFKRSPIATRLRTSRKGRNRCNPSEIVVKEDSQGPSDQSDADDSPDRGTSLKQKPRPKTPSAQPKAPEATGTSKDNLQYCTQACLLGFVQRNKLDHACPNANAHRLGDSDDHAISQKSFLRLMRRQLKQTLDKNCEPLGLQGSRGALFRLTLVQYGYTFVAKGTVEAFVPHLLHEGQIYQQMSKIQGLVVPVYLGNLSLSNPYFLDVGMRIVHMMLMSWAGEIAEHDLISSMGKKLHEETKRAFAEIQKLGIVHGDIREQNTLWSVEREGIMLIDFERSVSFKDREAFKALSPNSKRKLPLTEDLMSNLRSPAKWMESSGLRSIQV